jgi:nucleosome binding factor SPN SPT16 subunit
LEFRESSLLINDKCKVVVKPNMTFVVALGLQNIPNKKAKDEPGKSASLFISDTILVTEVRP